MFLAVGFVLARRIEKTLNMKLRILTLSAALALAACGNSEPPPPATVSSPAAAPAAAASPAKQPETPPPAKEEDGGICNLLTADEIVVAFGGKLEFGPPDLHGKGNSPNQTCERLIKAGIDGNHLQFGTTNEGMYLEYKKYEQMSSVKFEYLEGLGVEAFILNDAQIAIRVGDGRFVKTAVQLITFGEESPIDNAAVRAGVIELGGLLLERI